MDAATRKFWATYQPTEDDRAAIREFFMEEAGVAAARRRSEEDTVTTRRPTGTIAPGSFPKRCTCCAAFIGEVTWHSLPAASGGLRGMGLELRNHACGSTLAVELTE